VKFWEEAHAAIIISSLPVGRNEPEDCGQFCWDGYFSGGLHGTMTLFLFLVMIFVLFGVSQLKDDMRR